MARLILAAAIIAASTVAQAQNHGWGPLGMPGPAQPKCIIASDGKVICR